MPIYAYKCGSCGHAKDVLQKISDAPLTVCPACGAEAFTKQVTAAGFQLKGSGWYVTDFRGGNGGSSAPATDSKVEAKAETAHARTVAEARSDSARAQATVDAIGKRVAKADDQTSILVRSKIMEIHDALDATPGAAAGNHAVLVDRVRLAGRVAGQRAQIPYFIDDEHPGARPRLGSATRDANRDDNRHRPCHRCYGGRAT